MVDEAHSRRASMDVALGNEPADTIIEGGTLVDVNIGKTYQADVAIKNDRIAYVGDCSHTNGTGTEIFDASDRFLTPTFFDCHIHATGCQVNLTELAKVMVAHGTTAICTDLYEGAILGGLDGMRFLLDELNRTPMQTLLTIGYQMYIQNRDLGDTGMISADDMMAALDWPETIGISEWLLWFYSQPDDHPPVVQDLFEEVWERDLMLVGHAHSYPTEDVNAYAAVGASSDHEAIDEDDAIEKLKRGYRIMMKENGSVHFTEPITKLVREDGIDARNLMWNSDHTAPDYLLHEGNVDAYIREAISAGVDPVTAIQMGSLNPAEYFGVTDELGSIAPGRRANIVLADSLDESFTVKEVFADGDLVARNGDYVADLPQPDYPDYFFESINVGRVVDPTDFAIPAPAEEDSIEVNVIGIPHPVTKTIHRTTELPVTDGVIQRDLDRDIAKISVLDRHHASGNTGNAFIQGMQLPDGAYGMSFHPGVEDIGIVGATDEDMAAVANSIIDMDGGTALAKDGEVVAEVEMPILGVMPTDSLEVTVEKWDHANDVLRNELGCDHPTPWRALIFPCMPRAIPSLKICQAGLVDVTSRSEEKIPVIAEG